MRFLLTMLLTFPLAATAADWPMGGRTNDRNPVSLEKNAPTDWAFPTKESKAKNIAWTAKTGRSRSLGGPVISNGLVWVADYEKVEDSFDSVLACYRETDGKLLYRHVTPRGHSQLKGWSGLGWNASPVVEGDRLWYGTGQREIVCLDIGPIRKETGDPKEVWKLDTITELNLSWKTELYMCEDTLGSIASHGKNLYVPIGNYYDPRNPKAPTLLCVRKETGKVVWQDPQSSVGLTNGHYATPLVVEVGGRAQVIHSQRDGWVRSFDGETGTLIWKFDLNGKAARWDARRQTSPDFPRYAVAPPVHSNGRVYFAIGQAEHSCGDDPGRVFCVDPTKTGDVSREVDDGPGKWKPNPNSALVWEFADEGEKKSTRLHNVRGSVAVADGLVVAADFLGNVHCLDEKTGKRHWVHDTKELIHGNPLIVDGKFYLATAHGFTWTMELAKTKKVVAHVEADEAFESPPVFANGTLYVLSDETLYAIRKP